MVYNLINFSDPYTFKADSWEVAALAVFCLGTVYGAEPKTGDEEVPVFLLDGTDWARKWYMEQFGRDPDAGLDALAKEVADALDSLVYGDYEKRDLYEAAMENITDPQKREEFAEKWQDKISSLNNIGKQAHMLADRLNKSLEEKNNTVSKQN